MAHAGNALLSVYASCSSLAVQSIVASSGFPADALSSNSTYTASRSNNCLPPNIYLTVSWIVILQRQCLPHSFPCIYNYNTNNFIFFKGVVLQSKKKTKNVQKTNKKQKGGKVEPDVKWSEHWLIIAREQKKISQSEAARLMGTSQQQVSMWERGEAKPNIDSLELLCTIYGVKPSYFFYEK